MRLHKIIIVLPNVNWPPFEIGGQDSYGIYTSMSQGLLKTLYIYVHTKYTL